MGFRELIAKKPALTAGVVGAVAVLALSVSIYSQMDNTLKPQTEAFYTDDDGKTWFADRVGRPTPFDHNGKQAVRAKVFTCDGGKTRFVGYLERHTADIRKRLESSEAAVVAGKAPKLAYSAPEVMIGGTEVKKPGEPAWIGPGNAQGKAQVTRVTCPTGGVLDSVDP